MNLYPNDLGEWVSQEVRQDRAQAPAGESEGTHPNTVGSIGIGSLTLAGLCLALHILPIAIFFGVVTAPCLFWYVCLALNALSAAQSLKNPLSADELIVVQNRVPEALIQRYLDLALSVVKLPATEDETADREVREAITALGVALEALPPEQMVVTDDPAALRAEAQTQMENAQAEPDAVIAASRRRRAESLLRRADTSARTLLLLRRNKALREEVGEQIQALGTSLTALQVGGRQSTPELSGLAASIHRVALEANAVTVARAEVDTLLSQPQTNPKGSEIQPVRLLHRG